MSEEVFNELLKHPFINKTKVAALMRPGSKPEQAQKTISNRLHNSYSHPEEELLRVKDEFHTLQNLIKKAFK